MYVECTAALCAALATFLHVLISRLTLLMESPAWIEIPRSGDVRLQDYKFIISFMHIFHVHCSRYEIMFIGVKSNSGSCCVLAFVACAMALSSIKSSGKCRRGQSVGPSTGDEFGSLCTSMKSPSTPAATQDRAIVGMSSRDPPDMTVPSTPARPAGSCKECVTSATTGHPESRINGIFLMSTTTGKSEYPKVLPRSQSSMFLLFSEH